MGEIERLRLQRVDLHHPERFGDPGSCTGGRLLDFSDVRVPVPRVRHDRLDIGVGEPFGHVHLRALLTTRADAFARRPQGGLVTRVRLLVLADVGDVLVDRAPLRAVLLRRILAVGRVPLLVLELFLRFQLRVGGVIDIAGDERVAVDAVCVLLNHMCQFMRSSR